MFEEYFDYMDDMTPEQYCQFIGLIRDMRFRGKDTKVTDVEDKVVRLAWRSVRPVILKSMRNAKDYERRKTKQEVEQTTEEYDDGPYGNLMGYQMEEDWR